MFLPQRSLGRPGGAQVAIGNRQKLHSGCPWPWALRGRVQAGLRLKARSPVSPQPVSLLRVLIFLEFISLLGSQLVSVGWEGARSWPVFSQAEGYRVDSY